MSPTSIIESITQSCYLSCFLLSLISILLLSVLERARFPRTRKPSVASLNDTVVPAIRADLPGDSPAYHIGDNSNDVLKISSLDLRPNPPKDEIILKLQGHITEDVGLNPQLYMTAYLNGRLGPSVGNTLCGGRPFRISQKHESLSDGEVPKRGDVTIIYKNIIPYTWLKKGWYTVRIEMYASKEVGTSRMTGFEGSIWIEGGEGDGCGGWTD